MFGARARPARPSLDPLKLLAQSIAILAAIFLVRSAITSSEPSSGVSGPEPHVAYAVAATPAPVPCTPGAFVTIYLSTNFSGRCLTFPPGDYPDLGAYGLGGDAQSIQVQPGYQASIYDLANFGDQPTSLLLTSDAPDLSFLHDSTSPTGNWARQPRSLRVASAPTPTITTTATVTLTRPITVTAAGTPSPVLTSTPTRTPTNTATNTPTRTPTAAPTPAPLVVTDVWTTAGLLSVTGQTSFSSTDTAYFFALIDNPNPGPVNGTLILRIPPSSTAPAITEPVTLVHGQPSAFLQAELSNLLAQGFLHTGANDYRMEFTSLTGSTGLTCTACLVLGTITPTPLTPTPTHTPTVPSCDVTGDGAVNVLDVQAMVNQVLGKSPATADINKDGAVNVLDLQLVVNAVLGRGCGNAQGVSIATASSPGSAPRAQTATYAVTATNSSISAASASVDNAIPTGQMTPRFIARTSSVARHPSP